MLTSSRLLKFCRESLTGQISPQSGGCMPEVLWATYTIWPYLAWLAANNYVQWACTTPSIAVPKIIWITTGQNYTPTPWENITNIPDASHVCARPLANSCDLCNYSRMFPFLSRKINACFRFWKHYSFLWRQRKSSINYRVHYQLTGEVHTKCKNCCYYALWWQILSVLGVFALCFVGFFTVSGEK